MNPIEYTDLEKFVITKQVNNQSNNFNFSQKQKNKNKLCWGSGLSLWYFPGAMFLRVGRHGPQKR